MTLHASKFNSCTFSPFIQTFIISQFNLLQFLTISAFSIIYLTTYSLTLNCIVWYSIVLHSIVYYNLALYCTALGCLVLYCINAGMDLILQRTFTPPRLI